ncbi:Hypothetical protein NocV09_00302540 [Nannochloropsis oceanica]
MRLASQYTACTGCSAAVKALLARPLHELRLLNAVMADDPSQNALLLREPFLQNPSRTIQLVNRFPLPPVPKKVQSHGASGRCPVHRRAGSSAVIHHRSSISSSSSSSNSNNGWGGGMDGVWKWEEAWERLPAEAKEKVATIEIVVLEAAMHQATSTHRFCVDCKHNVVTALDVLTERIREEELENGDELNRELFSPFVGRIFAPAAERGETEERGEEGREEAVSAAGEKSRAPLVSSLSGNNEGKLLCCAVGDVEDLITWAEDFDAQEYTSSGQRHAATLEHGQREVRAIVGQLLLSQVRAAWHHHAAQTQAEQYLFSLVMHALRMQLCSSSINGSNGNSSSSNSDCVVKRIESNRRRGGEGKRGEGGGGGGGGTGGVGGEVVVVSAISAAELAATRLLEEEDEKECEAAAKKRSKGRKSKMRRAKAKARKALGGGRCSSCTATHTRREDEEDEEDEDEERQEEGEEERGKECECREEQKEAEERQDEASLFPMRRARKMVQQQHQQQQEQDQQDQHRQHHHQDLQWQSPQSKSKSAHSHHPSEKQSRQQQQQQHPIEHEYEYTNVVLSQSCYDVAAEERLLRAIRGVAGRGGGGGEAVYPQSLLDQLGPEEEEEEDPDDPLQQEMERLKTNLSAESDRREQLRSRLARNFEQWCLTVEEM